jgi:hypothetical protein
VTKKQSKKVLPKFHNIQQGTQEWHDLRLGKITASNFGKIMANSFKNSGFNPDAAFGKGAKDYAMKKALEAVTGKEIDSYTNEWMERGNELEPIARELYEMETFTEVTNGGFIDAGWLGASSDGLVDAGGIEIKSVKYNTHFERLRKGGFDTTYKWQIIGNIWLYNLEWIDFVSYCPDFPDHKQLYIFRVHRDKEQVEALKDRLRRFKMLLDDYKEVLT